MSLRSKLHVAWFGLVFLFPGFGTALGQELEPRAYSNTPIGVNFLAVGYVHSAGNVLLDPALPIEDLDGDVNVAFIRYIRSVGFGERAGRVKVLLPYASGDWSGRLEGQPERRSASGIGDTQVVIEIGLSGAPALERNDFRDYSQDTIVGASLAIVAPTGQYDSSKLINLGSNRWIFKPEIGLSKATGRWNFEGAFTAWLFTDNNDFFGGQTLAQDPLYILKFHAIRSFRPGFWIAPGIGYGYGGQTEVGGIPRATLQKNWRFALTAAYPVTPSQGISVRISSGINDGAGSDFDAFMVSYQYSWGGS